MKNEVLITTLQEIIAYEFADTQLLTVALTHSSFLDDAKVKGEHNERLEFLGDSVLSISMSDYLYKTFRDLPEGRLTRLRAGVVSEASLAEAAKKINMGDFLRLGKGAEITGGRKQNSILADAFEALIGAIYLDGGLHVAQSFVLKYLSPHVEKAVSGASYRDFKTELQEILQKESNEKIQYEITREEGPDHNKTFYAEVYLGRKTLGSGIGKTKKEAQQDAARKAMGALEGEK